MHADPVLARVVGSEEGDGNGDFKTEDTNPKVRVPRHKTAGDLKYDGVISESRVPRPRGVTERVAQSSPVRDWPQLSGEILQCGSLEDEISMFEKVDEIVGDVAAFENSLPLLVADDRAMWCDAGPVAISTDSELAQILLSYGRNHLRKCDWWSRASFSIHGTVGLFLLCG